MFFVCSLLSVGFIGCHWWLPKKSPSCPLELRGPGGGEHVAWDSRGGVLHGYACGTGCQECAARTRGLTRTAAQMWLYYVIAAMGGGGLDPVIDHFTL